MVRPHSCRTYIYNDDRGKQHFTYMKWLHVGDKFDAKGLISTLLNDVTQPSKFSENMQPENLQEKLKEKLQDQKFLVVHDDVWNEDSNRWKERWIPLSYGGKGSHVVITDELSGLMPSALFYLSYSGVVQVVIDSVGVVISVSFDWS